MCIHSKLDIGKVVVESVVDDVNIIQLHNKRIWYGIIQLQLIAQLIAFAG